MKKLTVIIAAMILSLSAVSFAAENSFTVKSGLCFSEQWGLYIANIVEKDGKISNVIIDRLANGKSSKELHNNYGIKPISTLGKDWWEQVAYYERWVVDNGLDAVETDDKGHALNPDLISGATINVAELSVAVKNAVDGKTEDGGYTIKTGTSYNDTWGLYVANVIFKDGAIFKVLLDYITKDGEIAKEKYDNYGMKPVSSINKDWWEQAAYYEDWVLKNGIDSVKYDAEGKALNVDLVSGATMLVDDMTMAVRDALKDEATVKQGNLTLTYSDHEPLGNMRTKFLNDVFFPAVERETKGHVKINLVWNGEISISYENLNTVKDGSRAQITAVVPEYSMKELPLHQLFKSFPTGPSGQKQVEFFRRVYDEVPELSRELEAQNIHPIIIATGYPAAFFSLKPLETLRDIKGQRWRSASFWHKDFLANAGATPVTIPWGQGVYDALDNGTLDGLIVNIDSGYDLNAHKTAPNILASKKLWLGHEYIIAMNKDVWEKLPDEDKKAIERAAESSYKVLGGIMDESFSRMLETLRADGASVRLLSDEEVSYWENETGYKTIQEKYIAGHNNVDSVLDGIRRVMNE